MSDTSTSCGIVYVLFEGLAAAPSRNVTREKAVRPLTESYRDASLQRNRKNYQRLTGSPKLLGHAHQEYRQALTKISPTSRLQQRRIREDPCVCDQLARGVTTGPNS